MDTVSSGHNESAQPAEKAVSDFIGVFEEPGANENAGSNPNTKQLDRSLLWRLDLRIIPWFSLLYLSAFIDRTNIGNAKLAGLEQDLKLNASGDQYNTALSTFFISYALLEPATNVLLKILQPSRLLPGVMLLCGIVMTCMGLTHNFSGLLAGRFFLGLSQAGIFPGINYILSCWYKRSQLGIRTAIFFSAAAVSGSFGGLLAAAIQNMDGIGGKGGWAWIFILEGLVTVVMGIASIWLVPNFPETATFLSEDDRAQVISLLNSDKHFSEEAERFNLNQVWCSLKDWKTWTGCIVYTGCAGPLFAFALFLPSIIAGLGDYNNVEAQLYTVPPYAVAAVTTILVGYVADKTHQRGACNIAASILAIAGFVMLLTGRSARVQYPGTFLAAAGIYPCISNSISWISNNVEGAYKRGISLGIIIGFGNLNGIVSCYIYRSGDAPLYILGHAVVLGYLVIFLLGGSVVQRYFLQRENRIRLARKRDDWVVGKADKDIALLGDMRPGFIYTL